MTIDIDSLTVKQIREISSMSGCKKKPMKSHSIPIGESVFIRTVTHYFTGRVKSVTSSDVVLEDAAWIADMGRYHVALQTGALGEIEPIPSWVIIGRGGIIDIVPWTHALPKAAK